MSAKKLVALVVLGVVVLSVIGLAVLTPSDGIVARAPGASDAIALVRLSGGIQEASSGSVLGGGAITPGLVRQRLDDALAHPEVRAVVIRLDSPGGTVAASQEIAGMIEDYPLPVVVSMADLAASGGYYVSAPADLIVAQPGTLTGSIGVIWTSFDIEGLLDKLGIELETVTAGEHKDMFLPGGLTSERRRIVQEMTDIMYDQFVEQVALGRGLDAGDVRELATGQLYTGTQALELGLVDELGGLEQAVRLAEGLAGIEESYIIEYTPSLFEQILGAGYRLGLVPDGVSFSDELTILRRLLEVNGTPRYGG